MIVGLISIPILPIENLPDIAPPTVKVQATYVGADAVAVEQGVTSVLEQQINGVENMDFITSNSSSDGVSSISVSFDSGTDGNINQVNVQNRVSLAEPQLPEEVRKSGVTVNKASNSILLVYNFVNEDPAKTEYSVETISGYLDKNLTDNVKRVKGVGDVTYFGNRKIAFRLWLDPEKLTANNLTATDVVNQLRSQNRLLPAGKIGGAPAPEGQEYTFTVQLQGRLTSTQEFENIILRTTDAGGLVRLKDVGRVELGGETYGIDAMDLKGTPSVGIAIYQLSGSNAIEVSNGVKEVLNEFEQTLPVGLGVQKIYDTTDFINQSIKGVTNSLRDAVILVLSAQYESYTDPIIILLTVPTALLGALVFLGGAGQVLNIYAQVGLVMLIGLAGGNAILIVDLANQKMSEGESALEAAKFSAKSRLRPILMTTISSLTGFLPLMLASGAGAQSQSSLGLVVFGGLLVATFLSTLVVPVFYVVMKTLLGQADAKPPEDGPTPTPQPS